MFEVFDASLHIAEVRLRVRNKIFTQPRFSMIFDRTALEAGEIPRLWVGGGQDSFRSWVGNEAGACSVEACVTDPVGVGQVFS